MKPLSLSKQSGLESLKGILELAGENRQTADVGCQAASNPWKPSEVYDDLLGFYMFGSTAGVATRLVVRD